jgi:hypothetical protein
MEYVDMAMSRLSDEDFCTEVKTYAMDNYEEGGGDIIECFTDAEIVQRFTSMAEVKEYCEIRYEARRAVENEIF